MKQHVWSILGTISLLTGFVALEPVAWAKPDAAKQHEAAPPEKQKKLLPGPPGLRFGLTSESIAGLYDHVFTESFTPRYRAVSPGVRMQELDQELANKKAELRRRTDFASEPIGGAERSPISQEFTYGHKESMTKTVLSRMIPGEDPKQRREVRYLRRFFFFSAKLWKVYDEYKLGKLGLYESFDDGVEKLTKEYKGKPQLAKADPSAQRSYDEAVWVLGDVVVKLLNREGDGHLALVQIDKSVLDKLGSYRKNQHEVEVLSPEVAEATSAKPPTPKENQGASPADVYKKKRRH
jgi:hypothetical protein